MLKSVSVKIDEDVLKWLEAQVQEDRWANVSHAIRSILRDYIRKELAAEASFKG